MAIAWDRIEGFIGFGNPNAAVVFLGMEEGLRRDADLQQDLESRAKFSAYMDLYEAQLTLGGPRRYFGISPVTQKTWRPMCDLMLRRSGEREPTLEKRVRYQANQLGRTSGHTLLCELLPYPHSDTKQWLYAKYGRFARRRDFERTMIPQRQELLRTAFSEHRPELIIAYGKANWSYYKDLFKLATWHQSDPFEYAEWGSTRVLLAPQLASKHFNTDDQLEHFASVALRGHIPKTAALNFPLDAAETGAAPAADVDGKLKAQRLANRHVRDAFGVLAHRYRMASGLSPTDVSEKAKVFAGQGNPTGVRNLETSFGWVHPKFAQGVFRAVGIPEADRLGEIYAELKTYFGGVTREIDEL